MSERPVKTFDCVESMRQIRNQLSAEIQGMSYGELVRWLRARRYADPVLERLAERAARQVRVAEGDDGEPARPFAER
ncbi:MAG: hypothetical protein JXQ29_10180 [Planctomycetes bacterium]|nr:hypothetical protein [Planctomycetota bacterium]